VIAEVRLSAPSDATAASAALRRLFDLDADGAVVDAALGADPLLGPLVRATPGLRRPGAVDGTEALVRAIVGQQVSVAGARTILGRLAHESGEALPPRLAAVAGGLTHAFPTAVALADRDPVELPMPRARARALVAAASAVDAGHLDLSPAADRAHTRSALLDLAGIGPWTADYVRLRALGDPDVFLPGDLAARRGLAAVGGPGDPAGAAAAAEAWRPWRSYALHHLWWRA